MSISPHKNDTLACGYDFSNSQQNDGACDSKYLASYDNESTNDSAGSFGSNMQYDSLPNGETANHACANAAWEMTQFCPNDVTSDLSNTAEFVPYMKEERFGDSSNLEHNEVLVEWKHVNAMSQNEACDSNNSTSDMKNCDNESNNDPAVIVVSDIHHDTCAYANADRAWEITQSSSANDATSDMSDTENCDNHSRNFPDDDSGDNGQHMILVNEQVISTTEAKTVADAASNDQRTLCSNEPIIWAESACDDNRKCTHSCRLDVNKKYELTTHNFCCQECDSFFVPEALHFVNCQFKMRARITPDPSQEVPIPGNATLGKWIACDASGGTVKLPLGIVRLNLQTRAAHTEQDDAV